MNILKACPLCKTLFPRRTVLCEPCREKLWEKKAPFVRDETGFRVRSLFAWEAKGPKAFDWLIRSLKGRAEPEWWADFALWLLYEFSRHQQTPPLLVAIPSRRPHALGLARALAGWTGWELAPEKTLTIVGDRWQKGLSRVRRQAVQFQSGGAFCTDYKSVIIIDDVVTTGATLRAAHHALGRPRNCEAWCLMDRRPCES